MAAVGRACIRPSLLPSSLPPPLPPPPISAGGLISAPSGVRFDQPIPAPPQPSAAVTPAACSGRAAPAMDPRTAAAWSLMERIEQGDGAFQAGGPYDQHGLLTLPRYRDISGSASPGMPRVCAPHFEAVLGQLLPHRGAWVHLSRTFVSEAPGSPTILGFVFWDDAGDRWVRFAALPWDAADRVRPRGGEVASGSHAPPEASSCGGEQCAVRALERRLGASSRGSASQDGPSCGIGHEGGSRDGDDAPPLGAAAAPPSSPARLAADNAVHLLAPPGLCLGPAPSVATTQRTPRFEQPQHDVRLPPPRPTTPSTMPNAPDTAPCIYHERSHLAPQVETAG